MELTKADKRAAREIIDIGLQNEFKKGLMDFASIIHDWEKTGSNSQECYQSLYSKVIDFDKHIAHRYDGMSGSKYLFIVAAQLADSFVTETDVSKLSETARLAVEKIRNFWK